VSAVTSENFRGRDLNSLFAFADGENLWTFAARTAAQLLTTLKSRFAAFAICYSADPGNTASIFVFSVAALNGLTM